MALQINERDRKFLIGGGIFVALFILLQFAIFPVINSKKEQKRILAVKKSQYEVMLALKTKYDQLRGVENRSGNTGSNREKGFSLYAFMDRLAGTIAIKKDISYIKPSVVNSKAGGVKLDQVELKLLSIPMNKLVSYLYRIETSENGVFVKKLSITKAGKDKKQIDAVIMVQARAL